MICSKKSSRRGAKAQRRREGEENKERVAWGFVIFLLFVSCNFMWAQSNDERPLRTVPPESSFLFSNSSFLIPNSSFLIPNSLLSSKILEQPLTQSYIAQYSSPSGVAYLNGVLQRASLYLPYIKEEVKKRNLPPELAYLPVVESSFVITAKSRSGAVGLWQFMLNSISPFDIKVNDYIDERRDFQKSTRGALQKLEDNYRALGNWELALAAYNAGLGAVNRAVQKTKIRDYWELSRRNELKQETIHYVPKFAAAAYVLSQPRRFGLDNWQVSHEWTAIPLKRQVSLDLLASESGADREILQRLNAELLLGITPADSNYRLKIPAAQAQRITAALGQENLSLIRYQYHVVNHGDTLWSMSRHYGITQDLIEQHNPGIGSRYLKIGEKVIIPASRDIAPPSRPVVTSRFDGQHVVVKGDTIWSLARRYGTDPQALAEANGMDFNAILREGRTLKVPILE